MCPPLVGVEGEGPPPPIINDSHHQQQQQVEVKEEVEVEEGGVLKEHNYFGVSDCSSSSKWLTQQSKERVNLKATELRLGLPGSESPPRECQQQVSLDEIEKPLFPLSPAPISSSSAGTKRPFSHTTLHSSTPWMFHPSKPTPPQLSSSSTPSNSLPPNPPLQVPPAPKAQVVGWPPIRSFRKNTLATTTSNTTDPLFVKVSMDGAPYLRKVDLSTYSTYQQLSSALHNMFTSFTLGQCGTHKASGRDHLTETKLKDLLNGSEYVLTYEDKDGDWMLVGDVPWEMFIDTCKRLKIMKSCDAIGLGPRGIEKSKTRS